MSCARHLILLVWSDSSAGHNAHNAHRSTTIVTTTSSVSHHHQQHHHPHHREQSLLSVCDRINDVTLGRHVMPALWLGGLQQQSGLPWLVARNNACLASRSRTVRLQTLVAMITATTRQSTACCEQQQEIFHRAPAADHIALAAPPRRCCRSAWTPMITYSNGDRPVFTQARSFQHMKLYIRSDSS